MDIQKTLKLSCCQSKTQDSKNISLLFIIVFIYSLLCTNTACIIYSISEINIENLKKRSGHFCCGSGKIPDIQYISYIRCMN